jgi:hypothetical protein
MKALPFASIYSMSMKQLAIHLGYRLVYHSESSTPVIKLSKRQFRHNDSVDRDISRQAYECALSVACSCLLFPDAYSLTRTIATNSILYSYYDHTPMCIFSLRATCNHHPDKTYKQEQKFQSHLFRKIIFNDVIIEHCGR